MWVAACVRAGPSPLRAQVFRAVIDGLNEWSAFDQVECPVLVLRGETSDLLLEDTLREMTQRGPRCVCLHR